MTSPAGPGGSPHRTSLRRVVAAAVGAAVVTWLLWHFAFGDSTGRSIAQTVLVFAIVVAFIGYDRWSTRLRRR